MSETTKESRFTVNVTPDMKAKIEADRKAQGRTLSGWANRAFEMALRRGGKKGN